MPFARLWSPAALAVAASLALSGCGESWNRSRDTAVLAIERGDNRIALDESRRIVQGGPRTMRAEAAYLGGIAAYRLGDHAEALRLLDIAVTSSDSTLRGQSLIQRGTVELEIERPREAARDLQRGGELLGGDVGRMALLRATETYKRLGLEADARRCADAAARLGGGLGEDASRIAGFTIQFGAFSDRERAESHAQRLDRVVRQAGLGQILVNEQDGLFKVQVGCYRDIMSAQRMMSRIRMPAGILATITEVGS